jgi:hypothetical protein
MKLPTILTLPALMLCTAEIVAAEYLTDPAEVDALLRGTVLHGTYLRTRSAYTLHFRADGTLINQRNETGRWWVNEEGQYCREWDTGRLAGNKACMSLIRDGGQIEFHSRGRKVAVGTLSRE